jgi:galactosamine-6-phosphate isomerase
MKLPAEPTGFTVRRFRDFRAMSRSAAQFIETELLAKPDLLLCASAGATPTGIYENLALRHSVSRGKFGRLRVLQIDEWGGLPDGHAASCRRDLQTRLLRPLDIDTRRFEGFRSHRNGEKECSRINRWLAANGPIDVCLLGLGLNGHVAMNEPADEFIPHAHVSKLSRSSLNHGMLRDLARKPRFGLTLGLGDILRSRRVLLVVSGRHKRPILARLLKPRVSGRLPASFLWLHGDVTLFCDRDALPEQP